MPVFALFLPYKMFSLSVYWLTKEAASRQLVIYNVLFLVLKPHQFSIYIYFFICLLITTSLQYSHTWICIHIIRECSHLWMRYTSEVGRLRDVLADSSDSVRKTDDLSLQDINATGRCWVFSTIQACSQDNTRSIPLDQKGNMAFTVFYL